MQWPEDGSIPVRGVFSDDYVRKVISYSYCGCQQPWPDHFYVCPKCMTRWDVFDHDGFCDSCGFTWDAPGDTCPELWLKMFRMYHRYDAQCYGDLYQYRGTAVIGSVKYKLKVLF